MVSHFAALRVTAEPSCSSESRWLPNAPLVRQCRICGRQRNTGARVHTLLAFLRPFIQLASPQCHPSSVIRGWSYRTYSGRRTKWTLAPPQQTENGIMSIRGRRRQLWVSTYSSGDCSADAREVNRANGYK
jgi:hypothetical protein